MSIDTPRTLGSPSEALEPGARLEAARSYGPAAILLAACLLYYFYCVGERWNDRLLDQHSFRQTQTAISTYYMMGHPVRLAYETPILGRPWSIPFEFPAYQWLVAAVAATRLIPLDQAGRLVSVLFFLLTLIPAHGLLASLKIPGPIRLVSLSLALVSPFYLFWSRSFLIESMALFFCVSYVALVVRFLRVRRATVALCAIAMGALAALVKVTTFAPWFFAAAGLVALDLVRPASPAIPARARIRQLALLALMAGIPMLLLVGWTRFADRHKQLNTIGTHLTSARLQKWNFGTYEQRVSPTIWKSILRRAPMALGDPSVLFVAAIGVILARRRVGQFAACVALYLSAPLIFTNLYEVHDYYSFANSLFLIAAVGIAIASMFEAGGVLRQEAILGTLILIAVNVVAYRTDPVIGPDRVTTPELGRIADTVRESTRPDEVIVILGFDWSPVVPYYSERRALMLPAWLTVSEVEQAVASLKGLKVGALLLSSTQTPGPVSADRLKELLAANNFHGQLHPTEAPFQLYLPSGSPR